MSAIKKPIKVWARALVDYMSKSGSPKVTVVDAAKKRAATDYRRGQDFYLGIRDAIAKARPETVDAVLDAAVSEARPERRGHFSKVAAGYREWLAKQGDIDFLTPRRGVWLHDRLTVSVNPELAVVLKGVPHIILCHYSNTPIDKNAVLATTALMRAAVGRYAPQGAVMAVLDVRRGALHVEKSAAKAALWLEAEAEGFISLWDRLPDYGSIRAA